MACVPVVFAAAPIVVVCGALGCQSGPLPGAPSDRGSVSEAETCAAPVAWYVDPLDGSDTADGASEATAIRTLAALPYGLDGASCARL